MEIQVDDSLERWLCDPLTGKLVIVIVGLLLAAAVVRPMRSKISSVFVEDSARYQARKGNFSAYFAGFVLVALSSATSSVDSR